MKVHRYSKDKELICCSPILRTTFHQRLYRLNLVTQHNFILNLLFEKQSSLNYVNTLELVIVSFLQFPTVVFFTHQVEQPFFSGDIPLKKGILIIKTFKNIHSHFISLLISFYRKKQKMRQVSFFQFTFLKYSCVV